MIRKASFYSSILKTQFEISDLAPLARSSIIAQIGNTNLLVNVCAKNLLDEELCGKQLQNWPIEQQIMRSTTAPLTVNFSSKFEAANRIYPSQQRREMRPSDKDTLLSRTIDRSLRPLVPKTTDWAVEITCDVLSLGRAVEEVKSVPLVAINASSLALQLAFSDLHDSVGTVNAIPSSYCDKFELLVSANQTGRILMMEGHANTQPTINSANLCSLIDSSLPKIATLASSFSNFSALNYNNSNPLGGPLQFSSADNIQPLKLLHHWIHKQLSQEHSRLTLELFSSSLEKSKFSVKSSELKNKIFASFVRNYCPVDIRRVYRFFDIVYMEEFNRAFQENMADNRSAGQNQAHTRIDGRHPGQIRPIKCIPLLFDSLHGNALFQRGLTQVFSNVTIAPLQFQKPHDSVSDLETLKDLPEEADGKRFYLFYNFPAYCNGEITERSSSAPKRREIGHANLAEKALQASIDPKSLENYIVNVNAKVLSSNGSSSMATICASNMALQTAGVKMKDQVSGIAMGFVAATANQNTSVDLILTDITGLEDCLGHTDCKIASTDKSCVSAVQLDCKLKEGLASRHVAQLLNHAVKSNIEIIGQMNRSLSRLGAENKGEGEIGRQNCPLPVIREIQLPLGVKFGSLVNQLSKRLERQFNTFLEPVGGFNDDKMLSNDERCKVRLFSRSEREIESSIELINGEFQEDILENFEFGAIYASIVVELTPTGVMVKLDERMHALFVPFSQITFPRDSLQVDTRLPLKFLGQDPVTHKLVFSHRAIYISTALKPSLFSPNLQSH